MKEQRYHSGEEIHIGDNVIYGSPGVVVFVIDRCEYSAAFPAEHRSHYRTGFMIQNEMFGLVMLNEADEDLAFVSRAISATSP